MKKFLEDLKKDRQYYIGCKLVRGAYYSQDKKYNILFNEINHTHRAYNDAINYLYLAQRNFPTSKKAPIYLFNRARILDDILLKKRESELAYRELIELYPDDSLSLSMKRYLESDLMNKSEQELLEFFNSKK